MLDSNDELLGELGNVASDLTYGLEANIEHGEPFEREFRARDELLTDVLVRTTELNLASVGAAFVIVMWKPHNLSWQKPGERPYGTLRGSTMFVVSRENITVFVEKLRNFIKAMNTAFWPTGKIDKVTASLIPDLQSVCIDLKKLKKR